jgi:uncharacterized membrane protein YeiH
MRPELYVTAGALAAAVAATGLALGFAPVLTWAIAASAGFALRGAAIHWSLGLPAHEGAD